MTDPRKFKAPFIPKERIADMAPLRQPNLPVDDGYENKPETAGLRPDMQEGEPAFPQATTIGSGERSLRHVLSGKTIPSGP